MAIDVVMTPPPTRHRLPPPETTTSVESKTAFLASCGVAADTVAEWSTTYNTHLRQIEPEVRFLDIIIDLLKRRGISWLDNNHLSVIEIGTIEQDLRLKMDRLQEYNRDMIDLPPHIDAMRTLPPAQARIYLDFISFDTTATRERFIREVLPYLRLQEADRVVVPGGAQIGSKKRKRALEPESRIAAAASTAAAAASRPAKKRLLRRSTIIRTQKPRRSSRIAAKR
ncbi:hypothetical protein AJ80_09708 [Polytolypa hystricis UAMH7299]|uniref:Uncharacterized protein n=1 Tax=Polytolypa hystricis (strain UAMH7299) TaxID=1447883 RepID=A0A2B7WLG0_POLH7|nr:hypothetical protein AJ80_09708 [Polytolypa hystricis UAMH7299]